jgi:probable rRNA maturation factor
MKASAPVINFHFQQRCTLANRNWLRETIISIFKRHKTKFASLNLVFCSDEFLLDINRTYLNHDYYTDIITFNLSEPGVPVEGEIYISIDRVKENASTEQVSFTHELHRIIFHGVLHLCGFSDKNPTDKAEITKQENKLLTQYFSST